MFGKMFHRLELLTKEKLIGNVENIIFLLIVLCLNEGLQFYPQWLVVLAVLLVTQPWQIQSYHDDSKYMRMLATRQFEKCSNFVKIVNL